MRSEGDTLTAELPGIPALPARPVKRNAADRKIAVVYQGPKERNRCETCAGFSIRAARPDSFDEGLSLRCGRHGFPVLRGSICNDWTPARVMTAKVGTSA